VRRRRWSRAGLSTARDPAASGRGLLSARLAYGASDLVSQPVRSLSFGQAAGRLALAALYLDAAPELGGRPGSAALGEHGRPVGSVGGAVLTSILSQILTPSPRWEGLRDYLPTHFDSALVRTCWPARSTGAT